MKSIIQEASSIAKAIELGWIKAGKPKEFTIKVYEEAEKNFLGLTKKNAKVGIFFTERPQTSTPRDGQGSRRPQKHAPQRRRFRHRRDDRRDGRRDEKRIDDKPKWYQPQAEQSAVQEQRHDMHHGKEQEQRHHRSHERHQKHDHAHDSHGHKHEAHDKHHDEDNHNS